MLHIQKERILPRTNPRIEASAPPTGVSIIRARLEQLGRVLDAGRIEAACAAAHQQALEECMHNGAVALERAAEEMDAARIRAEESLASDAVELGVEIASQIVKLRLQAGEYDLNAIVRATLAAGDTRGMTVTVRVNPADAEQLRSMRFREDTEFVPDATLMRGTVHVQTPRGLLVRDPNAALDEIREQLLEDLVQ